MKSDLRDIYEENKLKIWTLIILIPTAILIIGSTVFPDIFWESFLWKYFWGPVVADSKDRVVEGVSEGYNWVNTITYGIVLVLAVLGIYEIIEHYGIEIDKNFVLSLIPWVLLGGSLRTLEDVGLFTEGQSPYFISPIIYLVLGISAILTLVLGCNISKLDFTKRKGDVIRAIVLLPPLFVYIFMQLKFYQVLTIVMLLLLALFFMIGKLKNWHDEKYLFLSYGSTFLSISFFYNAYFIYTLEETRPLELVIIPAMALGVSAILLAVIKLIDKYALKENDSLKVFFSTLNVLIIFGHLFDASATFRGIQYFGYVEKHVLPRLAIELTGTSAVMFLFKIIIVVLVIYVIDILYKDELEDIPGLKNLIKFAIIVLGTAPALRNTLRLAMGV